MTEADQTGLAPTTVIELRQYKVVPGTRDFLIDLFEREFIESQEALGMRLIGQFADRNDPHRFIWIREFPGMEKRRGALEAFCSGPVWLAHRGEANPTLEDNDNVLLLRPATPDLAFAQIGAPRAARGERPRGAGIVVVTIHYLWKDPGEGFIELFRTRMMPELSASGMPVIAAYVPERTRMTFRGFRSARPRMCSCGLRGSRVSMPSKRRSTHWRRAARGRRGDANTGQL
jgi:hypothetical protein